MDSRNIPQLIPEEYLQKRAKRGSRAKHEAALALVPEVEPEEFDKIRTATITPRSAAQNWRRNEAGESYSADRDADWQIWLDETHGLHHT